jgi:hypothetical protein
MEQFTHNPETLQSNLLVSNLIIDGEVVNEIVLKKMAGEDMRPTYQESKSEA